MDENVKKLERNLIKNKKVQEAPKSKSAALELFIELVSRDAHYHKSNRKHNLPGNLKQKQDYIERTTNLLSDAETYEVVQKEEAARKAIEEVKK